jgi:biotin transport system substrate-specific component
MMNLRDNFIVVTVGILLLILATQIIVPLYPVPITLQTAAVLVIALMYNRKTALQTILCYILLGILGLPVFAKYSSGTSTVLGKTGGYILGFLVCVYVVNLLRKKFGDSRWLYIFTYAIIGHSIICLMGVVQLSYFIGVSEAIEFGLMPFIFPAIVKSLLAIFVVKITQKYFLVHPVKALNI